MKIKTNNFISSLNKISYSQLISLGLISIIYLFFKEYDFFIGILISGIATFLYTQLIKLSSYNKFIALFGFPIRLILVGIPTAILVHKLHPNLLALFFGFTLGQVVYFLYAWTYVKKGIIK